ncbi:endonuclease domain-containing protein [Streptomyces sp. 769]|uniref:endonuclease domain-containing protein n=1 Tax=Streptomyces sp. 769 TaxID=1262452 RepID=UPI000581FBBE|nr:endonuclease domain-containing protein [Streptomyces sp. 769]AJC61947.1 hypothetical protein GZL_p00017 [Streptomyces sp. 769]
MKARYGDMTEADRAHYLARYPNCFICGHVAAGVDHDHETDLVRGSLCTGCNSRIGRLEAALRLPKRCFQSLANDLHHALVLGKHDQLLRILGRQGAADLAYLGLTPDAYEERLRAVAAQLTRRFVYWVSLDEGRGSGQKVWFKKGPLSAVEQQREAGRLVAGVHGPEHLRIVLSWEPDDGVDSPVPRGLVAHRRTPGAFAHLRAQQDAARSEAAQQVHAAYEAKTEAYRQLVVPIVLSRPLTAQQIQAVRAWGPGHGASSVTTRALRTELDLGYQARWVDVAVRIALEDLGDDLPDPAWRSFTRARWHWKALCTHWHTRSPQPAPE